LADLKRVEDQLLVNLHQILVNLVSYVWLKTRPQLAIDKTAVLQVEKVWIMHSYGRIPARFGCFIGYTNFLRQKMV